MTTVDSLGRLKDYNGGFDVKYSLTPSLTLDTTFRTDFAQVEAARGELAGRAVMVSQADEPVQLLRAGPAGAPI